MIKEQNTDSIEIFQYSPSYFMCVSLNHLVSCITRVDNIQCLSHLTQNGVCGSQCVCDSVSTAVGLVAIH